MSEASPEALKGEDWAGEMGARWLVSLDRFEGMIAPIGAALLARAAYQPGERVLDLGCGGGATTLAIAEAVGPDGAALGLDVAPMLIERASQRAAATGSKARFVCSDAATAALNEPPFDRLFSRFGSMFFETPAAAFTNLRGMLKPGARIDLAYLEEVLTGAGFTGFDAVAYQGEQPVGGAGATPEEATNFVLASMAAGRILAEQGEGVLAAASADLTAMFTRHHRAGEGVMLGCKAWLVSARA